MPLIVIIHPESRQLRLMWASAIAAYFHYLGFTIAFAALTVEVFNLKPEMTVSEAKRVAFADAAYGIAAMTILVTGVLRVLYFGKGTAYYLGNPFFYIKMGVFVFVSVLSLYPTFTFISWTRNLQLGRSPSVERGKIDLLSLLIKGELIGFAFLPLFAAIMARMT